MVKRELGVLLCLLSLLSLLSPSTHMGFLAHGLVFVFGVIGFYVFCALLFLGGVLLLFPNRKAKFPKRFYLAIPLLFLGEAILCNDLAFNGLENASDPSLFLSPWNQAIGSKGFAIVSDPSLLGGFLCYELSGLLAIPGRFLPLLIAVLILLGGVVVCFYPLLRLAFLSIRAKLSLAKARRPEEKQKKREAKRQMKEESESLDVGLSDPDYLYHEKPIKSATEEDRALFVEKEKKAMEEWDFLPSSKLPFSSRRQYQKENQTDAQSFEEPKPAPEGNYAPNFNKTYRGDGLQEAPLNFFDEQTSASVTKQEPLTQEKIRQDAEETPFLKEELTPAFSEINDVAEETPLPEEEKAEEPSFAEPELPVSQMAKEPAAPAPKPSLAEPSLETLTSSKPSEQAPIPPLSSNPQNPAAEQKKANEPGEDATPLPPYQLPSASLLQAPEDNSAELEEMEEEAHANMDIINSTLHAFSAGAEVVSYKIGPSVTRFDVAVQPDVQVETLSKYEMSISARLAGLPTRYVPIVPKKTTSGFEIGNSKRATVSFREMFEGMPQGEKNSMVVPFGKSIDGELVYGDLSGFPHMLVAGTTGSGKSVFIHSMLLTLLMRNRPEDLRLVMVDPKMVEFTYYQDLPNLLCPVITVPSQAKVALDKLADLMDRRFELMSKAKVRDIRGYNTYYAPKYKKKKLPFIVVVVDEFADLAQQCKDIASPIQRLGQKARAAGIHMIIATQRPDAQTISGTVKSNLPTTVCLMVKDYTSSQVVLKQKGGEQLLNHGDMLVDCSQLGKSLVRCQGCFVSEDDLREVPDFIRSQQGTNYDPEFMNLEEEQQISASTEPIPMPSAAEQRAMANSDKYEYIKSVIMTQETTSISQIQRNFSVGFPRAGKIIAQLQKEGIVAQQSDAPGSSKGFRVLVHSAPEPGKIANGDTPGSSSSASTSYTEDIDL